jgi:hypothetical protein
MDRVRAVVVSDTVARRGASVWWHTANLAALGVNEPVESGSDRMSKRKRDEEQPRESRNSRARGGSKAGRSDRDPSIQEHVRDRVREARDRFRDGFGDFRDKVKGKARRFESEFSRGARRWKREGMRSVKRPPIGTPPSGLPPSGRPPSGVPPEIKRREKAERSNRRERS